jgi:hypothetical protein
MLDIERNEMDEEKKKNLQHKIELLMKLKK